MTREDTETVPPTVLLEAHGLHRTYPSAHWQDRIRGRGTVHAVDGIDLIVTTGTRLGVVGGSGCGKSTLMRLLLGLETPDTGRITYRGQPVHPRHDLTWYRKLVQFVPQDPSNSLDPHLRVGASIAEPLECLAVPGDHATRIRECLTHVGLDPELADRYPAQLSGGQRQRVALARALAPAPEIVIADEAVSALDASARLHVTRTLRRICEDDGPALVFVSHDLGIVHHLCDTVVVLDAGRIVEHGPVADVLSNPSHPRTQALLRAVPTLPPPTAA
ncbi:peptide/nickel transport system ATP-binding protein [Austwickia chelonae]|uniref:Putative ABC transporter ATP-binding protein n=1 Tax=Austwickia chelonae NBRC 105200 TaxID=1184607 RepID=K6WC25_9MICO|nr:ATP-binding cassette domain-containing protein [Austwickia chelonae]GAB79392.1 putative ABC transporter ATP-binding protein [Austwickia chelonae NBRC 105200]SEW43598.1 peptide/nickel transport system ATP-binding protein [Austwickia chelonae]